jgi:formate hydrogenlyase subunit 6/NADH:ubiquinone oxidoreductase subunit I
MKKGANDSYWAHIKEGIQSSLRGLRLSFRHIRQARKSRKPIYVSDPHYFEQETGIVTLQYPHEAIPVPDNGRYRLHNEIEDCIVCDKCAKVCPVDCIEIEPIKAVGEVGKTSNGSSIRLYAAKFDIDMAKCCFCGLCTTVCPTECLTMTKAYDFSEFEVESMNYHFTNLSPEEAAEKRRLLEAFQQEKLAAKPPVPKPPVEKATEVNAPTPVELASNPTQADPTEDRVANPEVPTVKRPVFRPGVKKPVEVQEEENIQAASARTPEVPVLPTPGDELGASPAPAVKRPVFRPGVKKPVPTAQTDETQPEEKSEATPVSAADSVLVVPPAPESGQEPETPSAPKRPVYRPKMKKPDPE